MFGVHKRFFNYVYQKKKNRSGTTSIVVAEKTKGNINKRGYNKFLSMDGEVKVTINYDRVADDSKWDGLKGYLTNTEYLISKAASLASTYVKRHGISLMLLM